MTHLIFIPLYLPLKKWTSDHACCGFAVGSVLTLTSCSLSSLQGRRDPVFLTGGSFPPDCPVCSETLIKLSVYGVNDGHQQTVSEEVSLNINLSWRLVLRLFSSRVLSAVVLQISVSASCCLLNPECFFSCNHMLGNFCHKIIESCSFSL